MATTKTLSPTNQTITIDAFQGEKPDHRHVADAETKLADAVNALNRQITNDNITVLNTVDGISCRYVVRSGYCYVHINGTATATNNITFTTPKSLLGAYLTCGQWGNTENQMQVFIDANSTTLTIRRHTINPINANICYPVM